MWPTTINNNHSENSQQKKNLPSQRGVNWSSGSTSFFVASSSFMSSSTTKLLPLLATSCELILQRTERAQKTCETTLPISIPLSSRVVLRRVPGSRSNWFMVPCVVLCVMWVLPKISVYYRKSLSPCISKRDHGERIKFVKEGEDDFHQHSQHNSVLHIK